MTDTTISIVTPEMTKEKYAENSGVTVRTVDGWIDKGYLPAVRIGKRCMVNVAQRTVDLVSKGDSSSERS